MSPTRADRIAGVILGAAVGDALGMPLDALSHQNVRTYYRGVRGFVGDEKRGDLEPGQFTGRTQLLVRVLTAMLQPGRHAGVETSGLRRVQSIEEIPGAAIVAASGVGLWGWSAGRGVDYVIASVQDRFAPLQRVPGLVPAAIGQATAVYLALCSTERVLPTFLDEVTRHVEAAEAEIGRGRRVAARLRAIAGQLDAFPLDLQDACGGSGRPADECWPFAMAMFARDPSLVEANLLSAVNTGGDAPTAGACLGALLGAFHGASAIPDHMTEGVEDAGALRALAQSIDRGD